MAALPRTLLAFAALLLALATALGAYASHGLGAVLEPSALATFGVAVDYQFYHALGLLGLGLVIDRYPDSRAIKLGAALLLAGVVLFCGALYAASLDGPRPLRALAPAGGLALIAGWLVSAYGMLRLAAARGS